MNMKIALAGLPLLLTSAALQASNFTETNDPAMEQTRTRTEMQLMGSEDQVRHQEFDRNDMGKGNMNHKGDGSGDGSGNKHRHRERHEYNHGKGVVGGYGSGYGSRSMDGGGAGGGAGGGSGRQ